VLIELHVSVRICLLKNGWFLQTRRPCGTIRAPFGKSNEADYSYGIAFATGMQIGIVYGPR
jgi:hypothetical protein